MDGNIEKRIAIVGIMVTDFNSVTAVNAALHDYGNDIVGRLGVPLRERGVNAISVVLDAKTDSINALTGRLGAIHGVSAKALFQKI